METLAYKFGKCVPLCRARFHGSVLAPISGGHRFSRADTHIYTWPLILPTYTYTWMKPRAAGREVAPRVRQCYSGHVIRCRRQTKLRYVTVCAVRIRLSWKLATIVTTLDALSLPVSPRRERGWRHYGAIDWRTWRECGPPVAELRTKRTLAHASGIRGTRT